MKVSASNVMTSTVKNVAPASITHQRVAIPSAAGLAVSSVDTGPAQPLAKNDDAAAIERNL